MPRTSVFESIFMVMSLAAFLLGDTLLLYRLQPKNFTKIDACSVVYRGLDRRVVLLIVLYDPLNFRGMGA